MTSTLPDLVPDAGAAAPGPQRREQTAAVLRELRRYGEPGAPAISLPPDAFAMPEIYELERERVFGRSWVLVAHADQLAQPGDYVSLTVAGELVLVARHTDGSLYGMSPICQHRMMPVVEAGAGNTTSFTCPYHLWRYGLDGKLVGATFMKGNPAFDPKNCRLPGFAVEQWHGFVFVNLDADAEPLAPHLARISADMTNYLLDEMVQVGSWVEEWGCNWKIAVENAHENYHVMGFHPETLQPSTPGGADPDVRADSSWATVLRVPFTEPVEPMVLPLNEEERQSLYGLFVFPTASLAAFGDQVIWLSFLPLAIDRTEVRGGILMPAALIEGADLDEVRKQSEGYAGMINSEDQRGLEAVQRAVGSRFAGRGHLSPKEPGVRVFYENLAHALFR
ncbi:aromatic ring-hydroxylating dioxygenase subunit alpha [Micromonospora ureilytica]|uniref:aromatic ring-hydroxylating oxygenase subunit alpha n=1 Tax=Micromonospora ureilytica TaxID=709868 RepID=UPI0034070B6C